MDELLALARQSYADAIALAWRIGMDQAESNMNRLAATILAALMPAIEKAAQFLYEFQPPA